MENRTRPVAFQTYWLVFSYRYSKECDRDCPNFMNRKDPAFKELTGALQVTFRELWREGVGANIKHATVFSPAEENALLNVVSDNAPVTLQRAVFFYDGNNVMCYCCVQSLWSTFEFQLSTSCMVDFQLYLHPWGICILLRMYILGNIHIVQDGSNTMAIKIIWSSHRLSYNKVYR